MQGLRNNFPFLPERMELKKCEKLASTYMMKKEYVAHIRVFKQSLNHGLLVNKFHRIPEFNQQDLLKPYIYMNTKIRTNRKNDFKKISSV